jgi:hypothetical protein
MPPRRPSSTTLFLGWFFVSPLVVMLVASVWSWLAAGTVAVAGYVVLFALFVAWRERTTNAGAALAGARGLGVGGGPNVIDGAGGFDGGGV